VRNADNHHTEMREWEHPPHSRVRNQRNWRGLFWRRV